MAVRGFPGQSPELKGHAQKQGQLHLSISPIRAISGPMQSHGEHYSIPYCIVQPEIKERIKHWLNQYHFSLTLNRDYDGRQYIWFIVGLCIYEPIIVIINCSFTSLIKPKTHFPSPFICFTISLCMLRRSLYPEECCFISNPLYR